MAQPLRCDIPVPADHAPLYELLVPELTDFQRRPSDLVEQLHQTQRPIVLTVTGRPAVVVQEAEADQELLDRQKDLEAGKSGSPNGRVAGGRS